MKYFKYSVVILSVFILALISGCAAIGKLAGGFLTATTADLSVCAVQGMYINNLYPQDTKTVEMDYVGDQWKEGRSGVAISFYKKEGVGFYKIDGTITMDGDTLQYLANGVYSTYFDNNGSKPKKISISTSSGQRAEFTIQPPKPIKLVSINGAATNAPVDVTKDMTLEFENVPNENAFIRVSMIVSSLGIRSFSDIGVFKLAKTIKIPAAAFKNTMTASATVGGVVSISTGSNYVLIERFDVATARIPGVGASQNLSLGWSWMPVTVTGDVSTQPGFSIDGKITSANGEMGYSAKEPNAFTGKPLSKGKKFAITSLSIRGTLYNAETSTSSSTTGNVTTTTTTTRTWQFPKVPVEYWDKALDNLYKDVTKVLKDEYGISVIPIEQVVNSPLYSELEEIKDEYTTVEISRSYKGTKNLLPTRIGNILKSISSTFASDRPEARLMRELGVDGLISVTVDLALPTDRQEVTLAPRMAFRITGPPNGYIVGPTVYAQGVVSDEKGVPFSESEFKDINALNKIIRKDDIISAFKKALKEQEAKEKELGYQAIWNLQ
ncbi:MAG: hypothetical protein M0P61_13920 [Ignavibacteriaceae bacterium]|nr:hypothetical protein [Ignavibacteriaceae bacterium]